jgi:hypothetical protein
LEKSPVRPIGKSVSPISNYFMEGDEWTWKDQWVFLKLMS